MFIVDWLASFRREPDAGLAVSRYAALAADYDRSCRHIARLRETAIDLLDPCPGEFVADVACGTGATMSSLARRVGPSGRVIGIEQSPQMAKIARERLARAGIRNARVEVVSVADVSTSVRVDALLLCYTHDVLQQPASIAALSRLARPGARYALLGMRTLPWAWGWPVNAWVMWRARRYLTTFRGLSAPWHLLREASREFRLVATRHAGTSYLAVGRLR